MTHGVELRDGGEGQTHQTVVRAANQVTALTRDSGKLLVGDADAGNTDWIRLAPSALNNVRCKIGRTSVGVDGARGLGPVAILDLEGAALLRARRRRRRVVGVLSLAATAVTGRNPEIGGTGVEVDGEVLTGRANGDSAGPLLVALLVVEGLSLALMEPIGEDRELRNAGTCVEGIEADILLEVHQVLAVLAVRRDARVSMGPRKGQ